MLVAISYQKVNDGGMKYESLFKKKTGSGTVFVSMRHIKLAAAQLYNSQSI